MAERIESKNQPKGLGAKTVRSINQAIPLAMVFAIDELATGLRRGELLALKWENIVLERGTIQVHCQIARIDGEVVEAPLKSKNSYRSVSIGQDAVEIQRG